MFKAKTLLTGMLSSTPALAQEPYSVNPGLELVTGLPETAIPIGRVSSIAADFHGMIQSNLKDEIEGEMGVNLGMQIGNWELKPLGAHAHCHNEGCEFSYSVEVFWNIDKNWAIGASNSFNRTGVSEFRLPVSYRGFSLIPFVHREVEDFETEYHYGAQLTALFQVHPQVSLGPSIVASNESTVIGLSLYFAHAHPH